MGEPVFLFAHPHAMVVVRFGFPLKSRKGVLTDTLFRFQQSHRLASKWSGERLPSREWSAVMILVGSILGKCLNEHIPSRGCDFGRF